MTNHEKIIELNKIWYPLISAEHHKSRDCHFYIIIDYHYGEKVSYTVEHKGYIVHDYDNTEWYSLEEAEQELVRLLSNSILEEAEWYYNLPKSETMGDYDDHPKYSKKDLEEIINKIQLIVND